jgi:hypothetical protein
VADFDPVRSRLTPPGCNLGTGGREGFEELVDLGRMFVTGDPDRHPRSATPAAGVGDQLPPPVEGLASEGIEKAERPVNVSAPEDHVHNACTGSDDDPTVAPSPRGVDGRACRQDEPMSPAQISGYRDCRSRRSPARHRWMASNTRLERSRWRRALLTGVRVKCRESDGGDNCSPRTAASRDLDESSGLQRRRGDVVAIARHDRRQGSRRLPNEEPQAVPG